MHQVETKIDGLIRISHSKNNRTQDTNEISKLLRYSRPPTTEVKTKQDSLIETQSTTTND